MRSSVHTLKSPAEITYSYLGYFILFLDIYTLGAALAMTDYLAAPLGLGHAASWIGIGTIIGLGLVHSRTLKLSSIFQDYSSLLKVVFVIGLIMIGLYYFPSTTNALSFDSTWSQDILKPGFAVSLIYVTYAYQGWNQAAYITEEIHNPKKNLPRALIAGTLAVTIMYVLIQYVMLRHGSIDQLSGQAEVATIAFSNVLGSNGGRWISILIAVQLIATMSSYIWVGSRMTHAMSQEHVLWSPLARTSKSDIPVRAIWLQVGISILLAISVSLEQVMLYAGFVLQLMSTLTILASFFIKPKFGAFRSPLGRTLQVIYILFSLVVLSYILYERPLESLLGISIILIGLITYFIKRR